MLLKSNKIADIEYCEYDSSNVIYSIFNERKNILDVIFSSGRKYRYSNCNRETYLRFKIAQSQGKKIHELFNHKKAKEKYLPMLLEIIDMRECENLEYLIDLSSNEE